MSTPTPAHLIRFASLCAERWRNGGGSTVEIARSQPPGSGTGAPAPGTDWNWRLSVAEVSRAGAFSAFPGCERILTVIEGEFMLLTIDGVDHGLQKYRPFRFEGGADTGATLPEGPIRDLNLITGPGHRGHVVILELSKKRPHPVFDDQHAVFLHGNAVVSGGPGEEPLGLERLDTVIGNDAAPPEISGRGFLAVVSHDRR
ncbi:MAG: HutD/Ves family protein [Arthrobacter sp.]|uniref:HutD/Ves family protein n=1 Tax=Arthrobacter sp. AOP36-A1-22 TaxID=3457684 RepID=UPI0026552D1C|nr:HutD family protein [Micrococcaceae bacterium]MDN5814202.1 HutD family protein [Micrococcaceae bacterium]MDN5825406.1 HutD family protein [Micrococcaceae bacterium]MDN5879262.1 HutD family protein [Micrococcaceae bacterium]MDN5886018.1 HutD family protein [Micrococcaceae bacterium]